MRPIPIQTASRPTPSPVSSLCRAAHLPTLLRGVAASLPLLALTAGCEETKNITSGPGSEDPGELPPAGIDTDGDGLSDREEAIGWNIAVDFEGYGADSVTSVHVTSDPKLADTDGDGLRDQVEQRLLTDPRSADTDRDGLTDRDEIDIWTTKPASVDTDGDSRGPDGTGTPNPFLFDGNELHLLCDGNDPGGICRHPGTSPTLADTDGDKRSDCEEFDDPFLNPLIADLPQLELEVDSDVGVFLNVEYAQTVGNEKMYGTTFTTSREHQRSTTFNLAFGVEFGVEMGLKGGVHLIGKADFGWNWNTTDTVTAQEEHSRLETDSASLTETAETGTIGLSFKARNAGLSTFTLKDLGVSVLSLSPGTGIRRVLATLRPPLSEVTLAPGEEVPFLEVSSHDVIADVVKDFLASPTSLIFTPAIVNLSDANGIDFDFLTETTARRTAVLSIDFGDGNVSRYRVATNVRRNPGGGYAGVSMQEVMNILGFPEGDLEHGYTLQEFDGTLVLFSLRGRADMDNPANPQRPKAFWRIGTSVPENDGRVLAFKEIALHAGDQFVLVYGTDEDSDGLLESEEEQIRTDPLNRDTDGDGLVDSEEVQGWMAGVDEHGNTVLATPTTEFRKGYPKMVFSDPRVKDTDLDGLPDNDEFCLHTDPTNPDTDGDTQRDGPQEGFSQDAHPLRPGGTLFVWQASPGNQNGESWSNAFQTLDLALAAARNANEDSDTVDTCEAHSQGDSSDDVSQIWVAQGDYGAATGSFELVDKVAIYGGFVGGESSREQRVARPPNKTVLLGNTKNSVVRAVGVDSSATLDGFSIEVGTALEGGGMFVDGFNLTLANLSFLNNKATGGAGRGGALFVRSPSGRIRIGDCSFSKNTADERGGSVYLESGEVSFKGCAFDNNTAHQGGALYNLGAALRIEESRFFNNQGTNAGGALRLESSTHLSACDFEVNSVPCDGPPFRAGVRVFLFNRFGDPVCQREATDDDAMTAARDYIVNNVRAPANEYGGAIEFTPSAVKGRFLSATNCRFFGNTAARGGAVYIGNSLADWNITNCTFASNASCEYVRRLEVYRCPENQVIVHNAVVDTIQPTGGVSAAGTGRMVNCIVYNNSRRETVYSMTWRSPPGEVGWDLVCIENRSLIDQRAQVYVRGGSQEISNSCIQSLGNLASLGLGNIGLDPMFADVASGLLTLQISSPPSPCIERGLNGVDIDPARLGSQALPALDLLGNPRIVDFDSSGGAIVDMGAFEAQP